MKKTLVEMGLGKSYDSEYGKLVVRPASVEPKYDEHNGAFKTEITDDYPHIPITKEFRDKKVLKKALDGGKVIATQINSGKDPSYLEFGIESIENKSFSVMGITLNQEIQRWFLNIHSLNNDSVLFTSHTIEECLNTLNYYLIDNNLSQVAVNDFIEKLTTDENLQFINKVTTMPKKKQPKAMENGYNVLQKVEDCDDLRASLIAWLGNQMFDAIPQFIEEFNDACDKCEDMNEVYALVDKFLHPKNLYFFREMERVLEWVNTNYDPRCLTDEAIRAINGGLDELAKECIDKSCKEVGSEGRGGYYIKGGKENEHKFIAPYIHASNDVMDFIDDCGYEMFLQNFNSVMNGLGYRVESLAEVLNTEDKNLPEKLLTFVIEDINPKKAL